MNDQSIISNIETVEFQQGYIPILRFPADFQLNMVQEENKINALDYSFSILYPNFNHNVVSWTESFF